MAYRFQQAASRNWRGYCTDRKVMDLTHINLYPGAEECTARHSRYIWPATCAEEAIIICDSLLKKIRHLRRASVYSIPGADIERMYSEITRGNIDVSYQKCVFVQIGTNNLSRDSPPEICAKMSCLLDAIRSRNKQCKIVFCGIIIRPRDENTAQYFYQQGDTTLAVKRREVNDLIALMLNEKGAFLLHSWECLMSGSSVNELMYYRDGLHLSDMGVTRMTQYFINVIGHTLHDF